jgi:hypothetical protein
MNLLTPALVAAGDILSCVSWKNTKSFQTIAAKETQLKYYKRKGASAEVLQLVELESKPFGSVAEKMMCEIFGLGPRTSTQNDATLNGTKIEIKCARYWAGKDDCVWQHLEEDHDYDYAMFAVLDFHGWKVWGIQKSVLMGELRDKKIVTFQGKQGFWTKKSAVLPYMTQVNTIEALKAAIQVGPGSPLTPSLKSPDAAKSD